MHTPLNASATTAGTLLSSSTFEVPPYQREYSWLEDEVVEFWTDLSHALGDDSYFLGLVILTDEQGIKQVVDGQQRILTLTLLAAALYHEAKERGRNALAERVQADFLRSIDYETDDTNPRVTLSDEADNETLQEILESGVVSKKNKSKIAEDSLSQRMLDAYSFLRESLKSDLSDDPFKRLGIWTDFITNRLYFAVFVHPDPASAYRVFEVINTRGRELTTADLLKNYVLSQTPKGQREKRYQHWKEIASPFNGSGSNSFVQYIRHVVTVQGGHILPKDLFDFLAQRTTFSNKQPPNPNQLMELLDVNLPLYLQMVDPSLDGPAEPDALKIFAALNSLGVISVRPILLAIASTPSSLEGMLYILRLVVRRIVVGNLGTGNVERRFGEAAKKVHDEGVWTGIQEDLADLIPTKDEFSDQLRKRSFNKAVLTFLRRSIIESSETPESLGTLHFIRPRQAEDWEGFSEEDDNFWGNTIGNTILSTLERRPKGASTWEGFKENILHTAIQGEWTSRLESFDEWNAQAVISVGNELSEAAANVWY
ncbi:DUF262 domain-containing protein [Pseudomonas sp. PDM18]|uniref:DUF262 domain-containing protein n=1 Tax=Pseudomonas sp. PDM18 TaxID=2769253 RepID=UPI001783B153|nr:DUF262 domain-containing protein [Pseudomonas sp. PDM18]MBD9677408.1 DUF262 domain-containing protein [Pseudomonas sp. PDM18]